MKTPPFLARREVRLSIFPGAVLTALVIIAGAVLATNEKQMWTAESVLVMLPSADLDAADSAAYYETMSRGQIVATFAEVADNLRFEQQAEQELGLTDAQRADVDGIVSVVPDTSVILVRATATEAGIAEQVADGTTGLATAYFAGLSKPYRTEVVHAAQGSAYSSSTSPVLLFLLAVVVALIAGLAVQQAIYHLMTALSSARGNKQTLRSSANGKSSPRHLAEAPPVVNGR